MKNFSLVPMVFDLRLDQGLAIEVEEDAVQRLVHTV